MKSKSEGVYPPALNLESDLDEVFSAANPNPTRIGCPSRQELTLLAGRARDISDPGYLHLAECSPCYQEFRALQRATRAAAVMRRRLWLVAAAILVLAAAGWFGFSIWQKPADQAQGLSVAVSASEVNLQLDLRPFSASRGTEPSPPMQPLLLPRRVVMATIILPVGSAPGPHDVQLRDTDRVVIGTVSSTATLQNYLTTLRVSIDLRVLQPGNYRLAVRPDRQNWRTFPVEVR